MSVTTGAAQLVVKVNFQLDTAAVPEGYLMDCGEIFGDRGNGYSYGWSALATSDDRERNANNDQRYDTLVHFSKGSDKTWEIALPNDTYGLFFVCGDPSNTDQTNTLDVEGVIFTDPDGQDNFDEYSGTVEVKDGRLTIKPAAGASNAKICFIDIVQIIPSDQAIDPVPEDKATDVPRDTALAWKAAPSGQSHDVYLGTDLDDVNNATVTNDLGVLVSAGQTATTCELPEVLGYGQTYYWRVDEVNGADSSVGKGELWSFTVEPFAYPIENVTATASSAQANMGPQNTVNGSGLNEDDQHSAELKDTWLSGGALPNWIQYEFDKAYKMHELWVWNSNQVIENILGFGAKDVTIEHSLDGIAWTELADVPQFAQATSAATYAHNTTVDFGGAMAKYVKLTINATWGGGAIAGLSEVRFFSVPVQARGPEPADAATDVDLGTTLNWRPGREATSHEVYFGADASALTAATVTDHRYTPASMDFGTTYYWKVNEVGEAGTYEGDLWSFTSQEFEPIDDFESYTDDIEAEETVWQAWIDGVTTKASGSQIGYIDAVGGTFGETKIVHGGNQSMPFAYDNATEFFFSEAEREFDAAQNWTGNGATQVSLWARGYPALTTIPVTETSGKMTLTGAGADIWNNSDEFTYAYKTLTGDGTLIARVVSNGAGTNTWAKGGVMIRQSLWGGSTHAMMVITGSGGNGASFQYRAVADASSAGTDIASAVAPPYWVKIERSADLLKGSVSADGKTWTAMGTQVIAMTDPAYVGLCVTSHAVGEDRTYQFDSIATTGTVSGVWQGAVIDNPQYNDAASMHLFIADSAGKNATATNATIVTAADWTRWTIPMSDFAGVNFSKVKKMVITIGDKTAATAGGTGIVFIDDIGFGRAADE
ncbi:MAG: discoidin domain-containing protein [Phycisphaerales bacterium]